MRGLEDEIDRLDQLMKLKYEEMVRAEAAWAAEAESSESAHKQTRMNFRKNWNLREKSDVSTSLRFLKKNQVNMMNKNI